MNLTTTKERLLPPLLRALAATDTRNTLPILSHLLLQYEAGTLTVTGSDLQTQIVAAAQLDDGDEASERLSTSVAVPGRKLVDIVRMLPDLAVIKAKQDGERMTLQCGRSRFTLATLPADSFPEFERIEAQIYVELPIPTLLQALSRVRFASASNDVRFFLNGVALELGGGILRTIASDGHRLAVSELPAEVGDPAPLAILPIKAVDEMIRLLKNLSGRLSLSLSRAACTIQLDDTTFSTKLIEGSYPDYQRVLPRDTAFAFRASTVELANTIRRASILAHTEYHGIVLEYAGDMLNLQTRNAEQEDAVEEVAITADAALPADFRSAYNARYLIDALNIVESDTVEIAIAANGAAVITEPQVNPSGSEWTAVVMPQRL